MNTQEPGAIDKETLAFVLGRVFAEPIIHADWQTKALQGGDVGDVKLVTGTALLASGEHRPYAVVLKIQKRWERYGDRHSWRREYDLYASGLDDVFTASLRWPTSYHAEVRGDETRIWMEYIDGVSGNDLTTDMLERVAAEIGRFQGRLYKSNPVALQGISNVGKTEYMKEDFAQWNEGTAEYRYIRSGDCPIPEHLRRMLMGMDDGAGAVFERIGKLPVVLCHRDLWLENIIYSDGNIRLIDWDTAGWGFLGEDIASLIADDTDVECLGEYGRRLVPAYYKGVSEYMDMVWTGPTYIREMILIKFGYRFIHRYMLTQSADCKSRQIQALQNIHDMEDRQFGRG